MAIEYIIVIASSVKPTAAMAFAPSLLTKKMSTTAKTLSRLSSSITGYSDDTGAKPT
jgi:hypothetical protein